MWDYVMQHVRQLIITDATLLEVFAGNYRKAGVGDLTTPLIEWTLIGDVETELWAPLIVQFDLWTKSADAARRGERRFRAMFHKDTSIVFDGYTMFSEYEGGTDLATPERSGFIGRALRFRFTPLRQQYAQPSVDS